MGTRFQSGGRNTGRERKGDRGDKPNDFDFRFSEF